MMLHLKSKGLKGLHLKPQGLRGSKLKLQKGRLVSKVSGGRRGLLLVRVLQTLGNGSYREADRIHDLRVCGRTTVRNYVQCRVRLGRGKENRA